MSTLEETSLIEVNAESKEKEAMQIQLQTMLEARAAIIKADADRILRIGLTRPLRSYSNVQYRVNGHVLMRVKTPGRKEEKWVG